MTCATHATVAYDTAARGVRAATSQSATNALSASDELPPNQAPWNQSRAAFVGSMSTAKYQEPELACHALVATAKPARAMAIATARRVTPQPRLRAAAWWDSATDLGHDSGTSTRPGMMGGREAAKAARVELRGPRVSVSRPRRRDESAKNATDRLAGRSSLLAGRRGCAHLSACLVWSRPSWRAQECPGAEGRGRQAGSRGRQSWQCRPMQCRGFGSLVRGSASTTVTSPGLPRRARPLPACSRHATRRMRAPSGPPAWSAHAARQAT